MTMKLQFHQVFIGIDEFFKSQIKYKSIGCFDVQGSNKLYRIMVYLGEGRLNKLFLELKNTMKKSN